MHRDLSEYCLHKLSAEGFKNIKDILLRNPKCLKLLQLRAVMFLVVCINVMVSTNNKVKLSEHNYLPLLNLNNSSDFHELTELKLSQKKRVGIIKH